MATAKKILVPLGPHCKELKAVHHALALAERIGAQVYILKIEANRQNGGGSGWLNEALMELVSQARGVGLEVFYHTVSRSREDEILRFVRNEDIDLVVIGEEDERWEKEVVQLRSMIPGRIIQVAGKE
jgi:nucleotide-binding universal stress UspA family protein